MSYLPISIKNIAIIPLMNEFKVYSDYEPAGDQPEAIKKLVDSINAGNKYNTLFNE